MIDVNQFLNKTGYFESNIGRSANNVRLFHKRLDVADPTLTACETNDRLHICLEVREFSGLLQNVWARAQIRGEVDGRWWTVSVDDLSKERILAEMPTIEATLIRAWKAICQGGE